MSATGPKPLSKAMLGRFARLGQKKFRDQEGLFLAEGQRTVRELLDRLPSPELLEALIVDEQQAREAHWVEPWRSRLYVAGRDAAGRLAQTSTSQGVYGVFRKPPEGAFRPSRRTSLLVALDDVQDPGNVGTIIRTAAWFGADAVICGEGTADPYNPKVVRSTAGSIFAVRHYVVRDLVAELRDLQKIGYGIAVSSLDGADYREFDQWPERRVLVVGNEANGVCSGVLGLADRLVRIPHSGSQGRPNVESLNASVSAAILLSFLAFA